jgi:ribosomal protein S18 acetylase RimI-like enzyme
MISLPYITYNLCLVTGKSYHNMTEGNPLEEAMAAYRSIHYGLCSVLPTATITHENGVDIDWSGSNISRLNTAALVRSARTLSQLEQALRYTERQFKQTEKSENRFLIALDASVLLAGAVSREQFKSTRLKYGFHVYFGITMVCIGGSFEKIDFKDLHVKRVVTAEQLEELLQLWSSGAADWNYVIKFWKDMYSFVGYVDGKIVTTATVNPHRGNLYLASVATHPDYRNRGYAMAISKYALQRAQDATGANVSLLHASPEGKVVYETFGFKVAGTAVLAYYKIYNCSFNLGFTSNTRCDNLGSIVVCPLQVKVCPQTPELCSHAYCALIIIPRFHLSIRILNSFRNRNFHMLAPKISRVLFFFVLL